MGKNVVNIALIGAGGIGQYHAENIARYVSGARVSVIVEPDPAHANAAAAWAEDALVVPAFEMAYGQAPMDAVVIATPARLHAGQILVAAEAGIHVFCEKPLALTLDDARFAAESARKREVMLHVGFQRRYDAGYAAAREAAVGGEIGAVEMLLSTTRDPAAPAPGYLTAAGGMFLDTAIHDYDSVRYLAGEEVVSVFATASSLAHPEREGPDEIDTAVTVLRLASGALATVTNSLRTGYGYEAGAEVYGAKGKLVISGSGLLDVQRFSAGVASSAYPQNYRERFAQAYRDEIADFVRCIVEGGEPRATGEDGVRALEIAVAARRSRLEARVAAL